MRTESLTDELLSVAGRALATLYTKSRAERVSPAQEDVEAPPLSDAEREESAALMRVNHVGEVCAQALYEAHAIGTRDPELRESFERAAAEEIDHLDWTRRRIEALGGRTSILNPLWYGGAFAIGLLAAKLGDRASLGFMAETERQVAQHLEGHLERLPANDRESRAIVEQMKRDETHHAHTAAELGGAELPWPAKLAMRLAAKVMTVTAYRL